MSRILHVVISGEMAGGQKVCLDLIKDQLKRGDQIFIVSPSHGPFTLQCPKDVQVEVLPLRTLRDLVHLPRLIVYLRRIKPELVHTHTSMPGNILWRLACGICRVSVINHIHIENYFGPKGIKAKLVSWLDTMTSCIPKFFIAVSKHTTDMIIQQGYPKDRVSVVYNGISVDSPTAVQRVLVDSNGCQFVVGCVGRLSNRKGQRELMSAFATVLNDHPSSMLWFIGKDQQFGGKYEVELRSLSESLGISHQTVFWGHRDDVKALMQQMDLLVLPSYDEGFPLVLLEAMSLGVPVIATCVAGVPEMITDEETGILIPPGNVDAISQAIRRLLSNSSLRKFLGEKGRERVLREFSKTAMLEKIYSIYDSILGVSVATGN